jgi:hypothetical protein
LIVNIQTLISLAGGGFVFCGMSKYQYIYQNH